MGGSRRALVCAGASCGTFKDRQYFPRKEDQPSRAMIGTMMFHAYGRINPLAQPLRQQYLIAQQSAELL